MLNQLNWLYVAFGCLILVLGMIAGYFYFWLTEEERLFSMSDAEKEEGN